MKYFTFILFYMSIQSGLSILFAEEKMTAIIEPVRRVYLAGSTDSLVKEAPEVGASFSAGEVIACLDAELVKTSIKTAESKLKLQEASITHLKKVLENKKIQVSKGIGVQEQLDNAEYEYQTAVNNYSIYKAELAELKSRLKQYQVIAPFAGKVIAVNKHAGEFCRTADVICEYIKTGEALAVLPVNASKLETIKTSQIFLILPDKSKVKARLKYIHPELDTATNYARVELLFKMNSRILFGSKCEVTTEPSKISLSLKKEGTP